MSGKLVILRGCSGSGKTTYAKQQDGVVVSRDAMRVMFFGSDGPDYYSVDKDALRWREDIVTVARDAQIEALLRAGLDVYADDTNVEWKYVKALAAIAYRAGAEVDIKVFDVPVAECIKRNRARATSGGRDVPDDVIRKQHSRLQGTKDKTLEPVFVPSPYEGTPGKPKAFLCDIDGTLAHMAGRGPFDWKRVGEDDVDEVVADIAAHLWGGGLSMIVMSGRDEACREETEKWLSKHMIPFDVLLMRQAGDMRPDEIIKAELFDTHVRDNYDVQFVIDDRPKVCRAWRAMGIKVLQVGDPHIEF